VSGDAADGPRPEGVQAAIDRYRDLAKYLIGILAAVGALLVAGTQLSSIGELSWHDDRARLIGSVLGLIAALVAVIWIVRRALNVLRPVDLSLQAVARDAKLRSAIENEPEQLGGAQSIDTLIALVTTSPVTSAAERDQWRHVAGQVTDHAAYLEMQRRFDRAWREMIGAAAVGAIGIVVLAWAANPPKDNTKATGPTVAPVPVRVLVSLTQAGREALGDAVGKTCPEPIPGLIVGGTTTQPEIVTTRSTRSCKPAQFILNPVWGHASAVARAG
jgi:hypothetical protein